MFAYHQTYQLSTEWVPRIFTPADVTRLLQDAGFVALTSATLAYEFVYASAQEWWDAQWTDAARFPLEQMPKAILEQFKNEVFHKVASLQQADGL